MPATIDDESPIARPFPVRNGSAYKYIMRIVESRWLIEGTFPEVSDDIRYDNPGYEPVTWNMACLQADTDLPFPDDDPPEAYEIWENWSLTEWLAGCVDMEPWKSYRKPAFQKWPTLRKCDESEQDGEPELFDPDGPVPPPRGAEAAAIVAQIPKRRLGDTGR